MSDDPDDPRDFLASVADKIDGFLYRCLNDEHYTMLRLTSGFDRLCLASSAEMVLSRRSYAALMHPQDLPVIRTAVDRSVAHGARWRVIYRLRRGDDDWVWVYETGGAAFDARGKVRHLDGVVLDMDQFDSSMEVWRRRQAASLGG